ncbi:MAG: hypothetical protein ACP5D0_00025 [Hydrogenovibrio sp.]
MCHSLAVAAPAPSALLASQATTVDFNWVAARIEQNETGGKEAYLTFWSDNEPFPSFGIGHFIWIPKGVTVPFQQTFPQMVAYVSARQPAPDWLRTLNPFQPPWPDRHAFYQAWSEPSLSELRQWLAETKGLQAQFIYRRLLSQLDAAWLQMTAAHQRQVSQRIAVLSSEPRGVFALIDYANFKGVGLNAQERYLGEGWGLLDVLLAMPSTPSELSGASDAKPVSSEAFSAALRAFVESATSRLRLRVKLSPRDRNEQRWLPGWETRLARYLS